MVGLAAAGGRGLLVLAQGDAGGFPQPLDLGAGVPGSLRLAGGARLRLQGPPGGPPSPRTRLTSAGLRLLA